MSLVGCDLYIDCFAGAAGDMLLGALLDLGVPLEVVTSAVAALHLPGVHLSVEEVRRGALVGKKVHVLVHGHDAGDAHGPVVEQHEHAHAHDPHDDHHHHHEHRHYREIRELIEAHAEPEVARRALAIFDRVAEVEARRHGVTVAEVAFHELGAADSIADIVGIAAALAWLRPATIHCRPIPLGGGMVKTAHGTLPVPAPATLELLYGCAVEAGGTHELTTPTGAAVLAAALTAFVPGVVPAAAFGPLPGGRVLRVGWGAGTRELEDRPNLVRLVAYEREDDLPGLGDEVDLLECNIDDMQPELLAPLVEVLLDAGALDAWLQPLSMKKGRAGVLVAALCRPDHREALTELLFRESTTIGVRHSRRARTVLGRAIVEVETEHGTVDVKMAGPKHADGRFREILTAAPELESCRRVAARAKVPLRTVYSAAASAAVAVSRKLIS